MSFFGFGGQQQQPNVATTAGGVPQDAIARLRRMRGEGGAPLFTSDLSVQDFYRLHEIGYIPAELVMGTCVYHIAHAGFMQTMRTLGNNIELPNYTAAIYDARELAMSRMQAEAEAHGAEGVVGMQIIEKNHIWQPHIIEFMAIGTSVERRGDPKTVPLTFQVGLND